MKTIVYGNQKGGVAKTTSATATASILTSKGYKVLFVDSDQQCNSTSLYGAKVEGEPTLYDVLMGDPIIPISRAIQRTKLGDIVPGDPLLNEADRVLDQTSNSDLLRLKNALSHVKGYDFCIIDSGPSLGAVLKMDLVAATSIVICVDSDPDSLSGLMNLADVIKNVQNGLNPKLSLVGILLTNYEGSTNQARAFKESLKETFAPMYGTIEFDNPIRHTVKVKEAKMNHTTIDQYAPKCTAAQDYTAMTDQLLKEMK